MTKESFHKEAEEIASKIWKYQNGRFDSFEKETEKTSKWISTALARAYEDGYQKAIEAAAKVAEDWGKEMNEPCEYLLSKLKELKK